MNTVAAFPIRQQALRGWNCACDSGSLMISSADGEGRESSGLCSGGGLWHYGRGLGLCENNVEEGGMDL